MNTKTLFFSVAVLAAVGISGTVYAQSDEFIQWERASNPSDESFGVQVILDQDHLWLESVSCESARCGLVSDSFVAGEQSKSIQYWFSPEATVVDIGFDVNDKHYGFNELGMHQIANNLAVFHDGSERLGYLFSASPVLVTMTVTQDMQFVIEYNETQHVSDISDMKGAELTPRVSWQDAPQRVIGLPIIS